MFQRTGEYMSRVTSSPAASQAPSAVKSQSLQLVGAALIGLFVVYGVGFSHIMPVHNAAHDARHSAVFPCH